MERTTPNSLWRGSASWAYVVSLPLVFHVLYVLHERAGAAPLGTAGWASVVAAALATWSACFWLALLLFRALARRIDGFWTAVLQGPRR